ncbi:MAG: T9SS type A sorting domain-containing protein, partial [Clostridia bacterium]|nr:T9SS type A sorting domain-containing protein [Clostridia bacterium]
VDDIYVWGLFDDLYPDFMPDYGSQNIDFQYPAFANLYGKLFLKKSSFPNNSSFISITNRLFHYFGDAYLQLNSEFPEDIQITHPKSIVPGQSHITIEAEDNSCIALYIDSQLIAKGKPENGEVTLHFMPQYEGSKIKVVATKQNHFRHESFVTVTNNIGIDENHETSFDIFPNPCREKISISGMEIRNVKIYNILGVEVKNIESQDSDKMEIDISDLSDGIYFVLINNHISSRIQKTR